jgi:uncharacterized membrane-anchored protein
MSTRPPRGGEAPRGATVIASLTNGSPWTRLLSNKVPEVSLSFWVLTLLSTAVGAAAADLLSAHLGSGLGLGMSATTAITSLAVAGALIWQLSLGRYFPRSYWLAVVLVAILSTLISDELVYNMGMSPWTPTVVFGAALAVAFTARNGSEHPVWVHSVLTRRREAWYWFVVLCAFSLGTLVGDLVSEKLPLGYATAGFVFAGVLAVITLAHHGFGLNAVVTFWAAYVMTRSVGDSLGGFMSATPRDGDLVLGANATSAVFLAAVLVLIGLVTVEAHRSAPKQSGAGQDSSPTVKP